MWMENTSFLTRMEKLLLLQKMWLAGLEKWFKGGGNKHEIILCTLPWKILFSPCGISCLSWNQISDSGSSEI